MSAQKFATGFKKIFSMSWMRRFYAYHRKTSRCHTTNDLEHAVLPNAEKLVAAVKQVCYA